MTSNQFKISRIEIEQVLDEETIGYLGLAADGQPYVVPLNYSYAEGRILFHCALTGQKLDYLRQNPRVCFTVGRQSGRVRRHGEGDPCHIDSESVICYGKARIVEDVEERQAVLNVFNRHFRPEASEISKESAEGCYAVEIQITEMTGRKEREKERTYWRYRFS